MDPLSESGAGGGEAPDEFSNKNSWQEIELRISKPHKKSTYGRVIWGASEEVSEAS